MSRSAFARSSVLHWPVPEVPGPACLLPGPVWVEQTGAADPVPGSAAPDREPWQGHEERWGARPRGGLWLVDAVAAAELSGYGGGHFPVARKWRAVLAQPGGVTVVANAAESEPLSAKDATLLRLRPHLVLDGLVCLAETLCARAAVLWLHGSDVRTRDIVEAALGERRHVGLDEIDVEVRSAPSTYLSGESSAIAQAVTGGPALPTFRGSQPARGARDQSVLVHNVETLARVAVTAREAAAAGVRLAEAPPPGRPASRLLTVVTPVDRRVVEVARTTRLGDVVACASGRQPARDAAVLLGGFGGTWARWADVAGLMVDEPALREVGISLGAGVVAPLWTDACGVAETAAMVGYLARASAWQCGPCLFGLPALAKSIQRLAAGHARRDELPRLQRDAQAIAGRGACHHPDGAVRLVASALDVFGEDAARHAAGAPCGRPGRTIPVPGAGS